MNVRVNSFLPRSFERRSRRSHSDIEWSIIRRRKIARAPRLYKTIVDSMPRCGTFAFRRVQLRVFKVAGKSGDWSLTVHKNERSGLVESLMRPTKRVARLRATNNSYLYPFPLSLSFLTRSSFSFPSVGIVRLRLRCLSSRSLFASIIRRSNSNSCQKKPENLPPPNAFTFKVVGSGPKSALPANNNPSFAQFLVIIPLM